MESITSMSEEKVISVEGFNNLYSETMGLWGSVRVKGSVDIERELQRLVEDSQMSLEEKYRQLQSIHQQVFGMVYGDGRSSDYR